MYWVTRVYDEIIMKDKKRVRFISGFNVVREHFLNLNGNTIETVLKIANVYFQNKTENGKNSFE